MSRLPHVVAALALVASACGGSTSLKTTWHNPEAAAVSLRGNRVVALVISRNEATRRVAEDVLASELSSHGATGIAAYTILPASAYEDTTVARKAFAKANIEGVVTLRYLGRSDRPVVVSSPPPMYPYRDFWRYYPYGWQSQNMTVETITQVETLVYSLTQKKLLWAGLSETMNAGNTAETVRDIVHTVAGRLQDDGVIK
jgi:hypothetical protein